MTPAPLTTHELIQMLSHYTDPNMVQRLQDSDLEQLGRAAWAVTRRTQVEKWRRDLERQTHGNGTPDL